MNILFLDQFSDLGGAQQCLLDVIPAVQAAGWNATCALPGSGKLIDRLHDLGVTVCTLPEIRLASGRKSALDFARFGAHTLKLKRDIARLADMHRSDLLYVNGPRVLPPTAWAARQTARPLIFHCHNHLGQRAAAVLAGRSLQVARARAIACCRYAARPLWPYLDPGRLRVIYNGVREPANLRAPATGVPCIGIVGRVAPEKGQVEFVRAARIVVRRFPNARFVVCGAPLFGDRRAELYFRRVQEIAAGSPVNFLGWQEDVNAVLKSLDILVVPSLREPGAPRVVLEAFAACVPVVAFVSGGIPELVVDGKTGFLVEPPTAEALAEKLEELLGAPELLRSAAGRAYETWKEDFTVERYQREVLEVIGLTQTLPATGRSI